jgi:uncharacterized protein YydD (DUF2326 family)|tara:strand:+ start:534 stop:743 length:210 start_codon:yes stop_codon:yes gene_type:complete
MTNEGIWNELKLSDEIKKLRKELKKIKADKLRGENDLEKTIDILKTDNDIKDYEITVLKKQLERKNGND